MLKRFTYALLALTLVFASCTDEKTVYVPTPVPTPAPGVFESGIIYYGTTFEDLGFYDAEKKMFYAGNIFKNVNGETVGTTVGWNGGINDVCIYDGKAYFLTPETSETGANEGMARIAVTDAKTFELEKSIYADGFNAVSSGSNMRFIYNMTVVDENKFYIGYTNYTFTNGNETAVRVLKVDANGNATFTDDIEGTKGALGIEGPAAFQRMMRHGNWIVLACGGHVKFIDSSTDKVDETKTIDVEQYRQVADVVKGRDGYLYAIVAGQMEDMEPGWEYYPMADGHASIIKIDPNTLDEVEENFLYGEYDADEDEYEQLNIRFGLNGNGAVASLTTDEILFYVGYSDAPADVYSYDPITKNTRLVYTAQRADGTCTKYMSADKDGNIYLARDKTTYMEDSAVDVQVINLNGVRQTSIENRFSTFKGDGGFVSTYLFQ